MAAEVKKWIWQHDDYPHFQYDRSKLSEILQKISYNKGMLDGVQQFFSSHDLKALQVEVLTDEGVHTSQIEGEILRRESVRASLLKRLDEHFDTTHDTSTHQTDNLAQILLDTNLEKSPLSTERLHGWHNCLFENRYSGLDRINVASFRTHDDMEVVSGAIGHEKIHYLAPPASQIAHDMDALLQWCECSGEDIYMKSAIAHLWFVIIHPYDDGNGRIARAITDYILSSETAPMAFKLYSISNAIDEHRKAYYEILDKTTNLFINKTFDITPWLLWHLEMLNSAMQLSQKKIEYIVQKTKFWDKHRDKHLNERQVKVLNKILDVGVENFEGGLSTKKYISLTQKSKATVARDIKELVEYGCIAQIEGTSGRNVRYRVVV